MTIRRALLALVVLAACSGEEVCIGLCDAAPAGSEDSSDATGSSEATGEASAGSSDDAPSVPGDDAPLDAEHVCDPDDPCATLPATANYCIDQCAVFGGSVIGEGGDCRNIWDLCLAYERVAEHGVICKFGGVEIRRTDFTPGACDEHGEARVCLPAMDAGDPSHGSGELD